MYVSFVPPAQCCALFFFFFWVSLFTVDKVLSSCICVVAVLSILLQIAYFDRHLRNDVLFYALHYLHGRVPVSLFFDRVPNIFYLCIDFFHRVFAFAENNASVIVFFLFYFS